MDYTYTIDEALRIDQIARTEKLVGIDRLRKYPQEFDESKYNYCYPTIEAKLPCFEAHKLSQFHELFYDRFPFLSNINWDGILIAGGAIISILTDKPVRDLDVFIYGSNPEKRMHEMIEHIKLYFTNRSIDYIKNKHTYTMKIDRFGTTTGLGGGHGTGDGYEIQFILRNYNCISEILHVFDIGSCSIGFDGHQLYVTEIGHLAMTMKINVIDLTKRSATYEKRLVKYFDRGFSIVLPNFKISELAELKRVILGELEFYVRDYSLYGNKIVVNYCKTYGASDDRQDEYELSYSEPNYNQYYIDRINVIRLFQDRQDELIYKNTQTLSFCNIKFCYTRIMDSQFTELNIREIALLNAGHIIPFLEAIANNDKKTYDSLIEQRVKLLESKLDGAIYKFEWPKIELGKGDILRTTFAPVIQTTCEEWYGLFYRSIA